MNDHSHDESTVVRSAFEKDIDEVLEIERLSFSAPWTYHYFKLSLNDIFIVCEQKEILGYLIACLCETEKKAVILKVAVHPDHRRKGVAKALLKKSIQIISEEDVDEIELDVEMYQRGAVKLYEDFGFKIGRIAHFMGGLAEDYETFYVMTLTLPKSE